MGPEKDPMKCDEMISPRRSGRQVEECSGSHSHQTGRKWKVSEAYERGHGH